MVPLSPGTAGGCPLVVREGSGTWSPGDPQAAVPSASHAAICQTKNWCPTSPVHSWSLRENRRPNCAPTQLCRQPPVLWGPPGTRARGGARWLRRFLVKQMTPSEHPIFLAATQTHSDCAPKDTELRVLQAPREPLSSTKLVWKGSFSRFDLTCHLLQGGDPWTRACFSSCGFLFRVYVSGARESEWLLLREGCADTHVARAVLGSHLGETDLFGRESQRIVHPGR